MSVVLPANPTGAMLVAAVRSGAAARGILAGAFAGRLPVTNGDHWLLQTATRARPRAATIENVRRLLSEEFVPVRADDPVTVGARVDRDPCWRCGVRGDVGCAHRQAGVEA